MFYTRILAALAVVIGLTATCSMQAAMAQSAPGVEELHDELRALKDRLVSATNQQNMDAVILDMAPDAVLTTMTNDVLRGPEELKSYIEKMFSGQARIINSMIVSAEADELSRLYADNRIAVATGNIDADFELAAGKEFQWPIRWTAVLARQDNKWLITHAHFSANAIENPLISAWTGLLKWLPWVTAALGIVGGYLVARFTRRTARS